MARPTCIEIRCKTALNRVRGMPFRWSLNPYAGCTHGCRYCYARAFYAVAEHGSAAGDFETRILVKTNLPEVLRRELARPSWKGELVALGTATDAYQPVEGRYRITRRVLEALLERGNPLGLVTKSPLVVRDAGLLSALSREAHVRVVFTITTLDQQLWRLLEPGTANPWKRLEALRRLSAAGVPTGVNLAPILPRLTDSMDNLTAVAAAARERGATFLGAGALRLDVGVREHFLEFLKQGIPELRPRYDRAYRGAYAPRAYLDGLEARLRQVRQAFGFDREPTQAERPSAAPVLSRGGQLALPL